MSEHVTNQMQGAFFMLTAEQLQEVAQAAADKIAAKYEAEKAERLCTPAQAAAILQVSKTTLWRWGQCNILHPTQIGGKVLYKYSELMQAKGL